MLIGNTKAETNSINQAQQENLTSLKLSNILKQKNWHYMELDKLRTNQMAMMRLAMEGGNLIKSFSKSVVAKILLLILAIIMK